MWLTSDRPGRGESCRAGGASPRRRPLPPPALLLAIALVTVPLGAARAGGAAVARGVAPADTLAELQGRVIRPDDGRPVPDARVELLGAGRTSLTDDAGRFLFVRLPPGTDTLRVSSFGSRTTERAVRLEPGGSSRVEITLEPDVIELEELGVTVQGRLPGALEGFARRMETGQGRVVPRAEVERHRGPLSRLLARKNVYGPGLEMRKLMGGGYCEPAYFVNGRYVTWIDGVSTPAGTEKLDYFGAEAISAVEIHPPQGLPSSLRRGRAPSCGAIVLWEREYVQGGEGWR